MRHCTPKPLVLLTIAAAHLIGANARADNGPAVESGATMPSVTIRAAAESDPLITQDRVSNVGKLGVSIQDQPFAMAVIDVEQIRDTGAKNLQEALLYSSGVYAGRYGFDTRGDWAAARGLNTATYQNGLRRLYGFYNNVRPELYSLETIEVLKGPASVLYGQAELGGIINSVTKRPRDTAGMEVEAQIGSHQRRQLSADLTGPADSDRRWLYRIVALGRDSNSQVDYVNDDARMIMPSLTWRPHADTSITVQYLWQENKSKVSAQFLPEKGTLAAAPLGRIRSSLFAGEPDWDRYDTKLSELSVFADHRLHADWKLIASVRKTNSIGITRETYTRVGAIPDDAGNIQRTVTTADRKTDVLAADLRLEGRYTLGPTRHTVAVGIDYQNALWEEYNYHFAALPGSFNVYQPVYAGFIDESKLDWSDRPDSRIKQAGLYLMDHIDWGRWVVSAALRYDDNRNIALKLAPDAASTVENSATTGRAGLLYRFDNGLSPYVSYSEAFVPNLGTDGSAAASYLKPTTGKQREAGLKYLAPSRTTSAALAWFDIEETNRVIQGATPGGVEQVGAATRGWEVEVKQRLGALELSANAMRLDARNATTQARLSSIAERSGSVWAQYHLANGLRAGLGARYIGDVAGANNAPVVPSISLFDIMVGWNLGQWDLRLDAKNLADKEYVSWCRAKNSDCGYGERRNVSLTARYRF